MKHKGVAPWEGVYIWVLRVSRADYCRSSKWPKIAPSGARTRVFRAFSQPEVGDFILETRKDKKLASYLNTEKRRWDESFLVGDQPSEVFKAL